MTIQVAARQPFENFRELNRKRIVLYDDRPNGFKLYNDPICCGLVEITDFETGVKHLKTFLTYIGENGFIKGAIHCTLIHEYNEDEEGNYNEDIDEYEIPESQTSVYEKTLLDWGFKMVSEFKNLNSNNILRMYVATADDVYGE